MSVNVNEVIRKLSPADRKKVEDRAAGRSSREAQRSVFPRCSHNGSASLGAALPAQHIPAGTAITRS